jgi:hypothetical protein
VALERSAAISAIRGRLLGRISDTQLSAWIFSMVWDTAVFFGPELSPNSNVVSRMGLVFSLLQNGSLRIDQFAPYTLDKAMIDGSYYSEKAPGQALVALPFVGAAMVGAHAAGYPTAPIAAGEFTPFYHLVLWVAVAFTSSLFTAAAAACLYLLARHLGASRRGALFASLGFGFCTPALGWGTMFFGHAMAAGCPLLSFAAIVFGSAERPAARSPCRLWRGDGDVSRAGDPDGVHLGPSGSDHRHRGPVASAPSSATASCAAGALAHLHAVRLG